ncbi:MAG: response regulator [Candidatus Tectimicrobiota bacterium]
MEQPNPQHYLSELQADIAANDPIKAQILLSYFSTLPPQLQHRTLFELSRCASEFAVPLLLQLSSEQPPEASVTTTIHSLLLEKLLEQPSLLVTLLAQPESAGKPILIELAGELQMEAAVPCLVAMLHQETARDRLLSILDALGAIGHAAATSVLSDYLYADAQSLVTAAIRGLARLATPTAVQRLAERMGTDNELDCLILDAFGSMQDSLALSKLNEALRSHQARIRTHAKTVLQQLGAKAVPVLLDNLRYGDDPDLLIHTLNVLGLIGDVSAVSPIRKLLHSEPRDPNVRFAAYEALGLLPLQKGAFVLAEGLADTVEHVRIAAARALERQHNDIVLAGIKNLLAQDESQVRNTVQALLFAEADTLCLRLLDEAPFQQLAMQTLRTVAHPDLRRHFDQLLRQHGRRQLAEQLDQQATEAVAPSKGVVYAVDDSRMMLKVYQNTLHQLGYTPVLFEFPVHALAQAKLTKPDLLVTDLNMPDMTGLELTSKLRTLYSAETLPIIMITTQDDTQSTDEARAVGVTALLPKPFTAAQLAATLERFAA